MLTPGRANAASGQDSIPGQIVPGTEQANAWRSLRTFEGADDGVGEVLS